jgi:threonine efflux protein
MIVNTVLSADVLLAYSAYFIGTASPGPSNLAIMSIATGSGRKAALAFAAGVVSGSCFWAVLAALGLSAALLAYSGFIVAVKIFGGLYLLWLAFKSGRAALGHGARLAPDAAPPQSLRQLYGRGALLHLTNPKAILVWISVVALSAPVHGGPSHMGVVVAGCLCIGMTVFSAYAALFSTAAARRIYGRMRRWMEGCLAVVFALAGIKLLSSRA